MDRYTLLCTQRCVCLVCTVCVLIPLINQYSSTTRGAHYCFRHVYRTLISVTNPSACFLTFFTQTQENKSDIKIGNSFRCKTPTRAQNSLRGQGRREGRPLSWNFMFFMFFGLGVSRSSLCGTTAQPFIGIFNKLSLQPVCQLVTDHTCLIEANSH